MTFEFHYDGVAHLREHARAALCDEPGLGKSRQLLLAAEAPVFVLAPAMVLEGGTWDDEIAKWRPDLEPGVDVVQVAYTELCERVYYDHPTQRNQDGSPRQLHRPVGRARPEYRQQWGTVIADEAHYLKGRKTLWVDAFFQLAVRQSRIYCATGTPIPNWAHELFNLAKILDPSAAAPGGRLGSYWRWAGRYFNTQPTRFSRGMPSIGKFLDDTPEGWLRFYEENLGDQYLARTWEQVLPDVEPMREQTVLCPMTPAQRKVYRDLKRDYLAIVEATGTELIAWSAGGLDQKLRQVCTGVEVLDPGAGASGKLERLRVDLDNAAGQTFVVAYYRRSVEAACRVAREAGKRAAFVHRETPKPARKVIVRDFQQGRLDVLVGSIETVAEGLNLGNAHVVIRIERSWRPSRNDQVRRRIRRISDLSPRLCIDYVTPDSLDERMLPVLAAKTDQQMKALRAREFAALL